MFVFGFPPDGDSCAAPSAEYIHQLPGYSKQTLSDSRLTSLRLKLYKISEFDPFNIHVQQV